LRGLRVQHSRALFKLVEVLLLQGWLILRPNWLNGGFLLHVDVVLSQQILLDLLLLLVLLVNLKLRIELVAPTLRLVTHHLLIVHTLVDTLVLLS